MKYEKDCNIFNNDPVFRISCSEDVKVNPELAGPLYGLTKGEPGSWMS